MINWTQNFLARIKASGIMQPLARKWLGDLLTITQ